MIMTTEMDLFAKYSMAWHNDNQSGESDYVRPHGQPYEERADNYAAQIAKAHGVPHHKAAEALDQVQYHHYEEKHFAHPTDYGFDSAPSHNSALVHPDTMKWMDHDWRNTKVEDVPIHRGVHATQNFVKPHVVAHNLFHPGMHEPSREEEVGDPDHVPDTDSSDDDDEYRDSLQQGDYPRFAERADGSHDVIDGHHRVAADIILGKTHTPGRVIPYHHPDDD